MFRGSVPADMQSIISEHSRQWQCQNVYVGCSGNFTVERVLQGRFHLHGNDVQMYSSTIGSYLAQKLFPISIRPEYQDRFGWLQSFIDKPDRALATVMLCSRMLQGMNSFNAYYDKVRAEYRQQWPAMFGKTLEKIQKTTLKLDSFDCGDVVDFVQMVPNDEAFVVFPPFFSGDYEEQFKGLDELFKWPKPDYPMMDHARMENLVGMMLEKKYWLFGNNQRWPGLESSLRGIVQTTNRGVSIYIYTSHGPKRVVQPRQAITQVNTPRLSPGDTIGDRMALAKLTSEQFRALRSQYMNENIKPGQESLAVGVLVDGKLIGVYAFMSDSKTVNYDSKLLTPYMYLLSDFPVAPTDYPRLSKLVLYAALSKESKLLAEQLARHRVRSLVTTAFSKRPVSMKYRGIFQLLSRTENKVSDEQLEKMDPATAYYANSFKINYGGAMGDWTLDEGLALWKQKHGQKGK